MADAYDIDLDASPPKRGGRADKSKAQSRRRSSTGDAVDESGSRPSTSAKLAALRQQIETRKAQAGAATAGRGSLEERVAARLAALSSQRNSVSIGEEAPAAPPPAPPKPIDPAFARAASIAAAAKKAAAHAVQAARSRRVSTEEEREERRRAAAAAIENDEDGESSLEVTPADLEVGPAAAAAQLPPRPAGRAIAAASSASTPATTGGTSGLQISASDAAPAVVKASVSPTRGRSASQADVDKLTFADLAALLRAPVVAPARSSAAVTGAAEPSPRVAASAVAALARSRAAIADRVAAGLPPSPVPPPDAPVPLAAPAQLLAAASPDEAADEYSADTFAESSGGGTGRGALAGAETAAVAAPSDVPPISIPLPPTLPEQRRASSTAPPLSSPVEAASAPQASPAIAAVAAAPTPPSSALGSPKSPGAYRPPAGGDESFASTVAPPPPPPKPQPPPRAPQPAETSPPATQPATATASSDDSRLGHALAPPQPPRGPPPPAYPSPSAGWGYHYPPPPGLDVSGHPPPPPPGYPPGYAVYPGPFQPPQYMYPQHPSTFQHFGPPMDVTFGSRGAPPPPPPPVVSESSRTAGAALAIALRAAASVALSKSLTHATAPAPAAHEQRPAPKASDAGSVQATSAPADAQLSVSFAAPASNAEKGDAPLASSGSGGTSAKQADRKTRMPRKREVEPAPSGQQPSQGLAGSAERATRRSTSSSRRTAPEGREVYENGPQEDLARGKADAGGAANALIVKAMAERYAAESARAGLEAEVGRLQGLLLAVQQQRLSPSGRSTAPLRSGQPAFPPAPALSLISFVDEPSLPTASNVAPPFDAQTIDPPPHASSAAAADVSVPVSTRSAPPAAPPTSIRPDAPLSNGPSSQPRARAARLRATANAWAAAAPAPPADAHANEDDSTPALAPSDDVSLPATLREALAAAAVFRPLVTATRGALGQRRWPADAAPHAQTAASRTHRGVVYPLGPDSAAYFTDLDAAEAQAQGDGFQAFVPLRLVKALQGEMEVQERLMAALNQDNARMRRELNAAAAPGPGAASGTSVRPPVQPLGSFAPPAALSEATSGRRGSDVAADLRRELAAAADAERLRGLLADVTATAATREAELHAELEAQRRARADLEFRLGGVDVPAMKRDAAEARRHEAAVAELVARHAREVEALEQRLAWYRDNQAILDQDRDTLTRQAAQIRQLKAQLEGGDGGGGGDGDATAESSGDVNPADAVAGRQQRAVLMHHLAVAKRRIAELEKDLAAAQQALDKRRPDSLASLIRAAKGADGAVGEPAQLLQELARVRTEAHEAAEAHDRQLRALRQQHELLKAQYAGAGSRAGGADSGEVAAAAPGLAARAAPGEPSAVAAAAAAAKREAALKARIESLDKELERVRAFYVAKVKELTAQVKELQAAPAPPQTQHRSSHVAGSAARTAPAASTTTRPAGGATPSRRIPASSGTHSRVGAALPHGDATGSGGGTHAGDGSLTAGGAAASESESALRQPAPQPEQAGLAAPDALVRRTPQRSRGAGGGAPPLVPGESVAGDSSSGGEVAQPQPFQQQAALQAALDDVQRRLTSTEESVRALSDENKRLRSSAPPATAAAATSDARPLAPVPASGVSADVARLSSAIALLEARAEARELELVRAERAALSAQDGQLDLERSRFRDALRVKDEALAQCRRELVQMMAALQAQRKY